MFYPTALPMVRTILVPIRSAHVYMFEAMVGLVRDKAYSYDYRNYLRVLCEHILNPGDNRRFDQSLLDIKNSLLNMGIKYEVVISIEHHVTALLIECLTPYYDLIEALREDRSKRFIGFRVDVQSKGTEAKIWLDYDEKYLGNGPHYPRV